MSRINCVIPDAYASTFPFVLPAGTIAILFVIDPSSAFSVETVGHWATILHHLGIPDNIISADLQILKALECEHQPDVLT